jgi:hypothetical protein
MLIKGISSLPTNQIDIAKNVIHVMSADSSVRKVISRRLDGRDFILVATKLALEFILSALHL